MKKREFTIENEYKYNYKSSVAWLVSHMMKYKFYVLGFILASILMTVLSVNVSRLTGDAFNFVLESSMDRDRFKFIVFGILGASFAILAAKLSNYFFIEIIASRIERDTREELYLNLLGKSQTFHNRHRAGDIMASAGNDVQFLNGMTNPGLSNIFNAVVNLVVPIIFIAYINSKLLLVPVIFEAFFLVSLRHYAKRFFPVAAETTKSFSTMSADLTEVLSGIVVVKGAGQEEKEISKFAKNVSWNRDINIKKGKLQASYLPPLFFGLALVLSFIHSIILYRQGSVKVGDIVYYIGLVSMLNAYSATFIDSFSHIQLGMAAARRILGLIKSDTEVDENAGGYSGKMKGSITFENVTFAYDNGTVLEDISFSVKPGQVVAIVGQTGSGKTTLSKLINRIYDVKSGKILIDGIDVKEWSLESLRSQISAIEQEISLFSRSIASNISFGLGRQMDMESIEQAAKMAQAHKFITSLKDGYCTMLGDQGVTLSGGERQRIALARTILVNPSIVILDDSTSAIDSTTEEEIQQAIRNVLQGRTTIVITHRLAQIKKADKILMLKKGRLIDQGTHEELLARCDAYNSLFYHKELKFVKKEGVKCPTII